MQHGREILDYRTPQLGSSEALVPPWSVAAMTWLCAASVGAFVGLLLSWAFCKFLPPFAVLGWPIWVPVGAILALILQRRRLCKQRGTIRWSWLGFPLTIGMFIWVQCGSNGQLRAELQHGVRLPLSCRSIQCGGNIFMSHEGQAVTWFEMNSPDLAGFLGRLPIDQRNGSWASWNTASGRKRVWAPWSTESEFSSRFVKTWAGTEKLNQTLRCWSPVGASSLMVEIYDLPNGGHLVKMLSSWD